MYFINRPDATGHQNADCASVPDKQQGIPHSNFKSKSKSNSEPQNNVIILAAVRKSVRHVETTNFKYPMLECS